MASGAASEGREGRAALFVAIYDAKGCWDDAGPCFRRAGVVLVAQQYHAHSVACCLERRLEVAGALLREASHGALCGGQRPPPDEQNLALAI